MNKTKICLRCSQNASDGLDFEVMKVTQWKSGSVRKGNYSAGQELTGFETYRVCESCIQKKLDEINRPFSRFPEKFKTTVFLLIVGGGLIASFWDTRDAGFAVGIFLVVFFFVKFYRFVRDGYKKKKAFAKFSVNNARFVAAWESLSEVAPRKDARGRGVFFIPATKAAYSMTSDDFHKYYRLNEANAQAFYDMLQKKKEEDHADC